MPQEALPLVLRHPLAGVSWLSREDATFPLLNAGFLVPDAYYLTGR
jgi:hypothetical protein